MTTWLEFRSEPMSDVPEMIIKLVVFTNRWRFGGAPRRDLVCNDANCNYVDHTWLGPTKAIELKREHQKWHEDGMPQ